MKRNINKYTILALSAVLSLASVSCNKFLDEMPDNRAELNSEDKVSKILVSAYPTTAYLLPAEISTDNVDDYGVTNPNYDRLLEQLFNWNDVSETGNDSPYDLWEACYGAIASANAALKAIEDLGSPETLNPQKGEALVARAYSHFILVNVFSHHYTKAHADKDLGIPYMLEPETKLNPQYSRGTVAETYQNIKKDIEEGIPLINDASYGGTPKWHMNKAAAYAFAARVALYTQDWQNAVKYSSLAVGSNPVSQLRDNAKLASIGTDLLNMSINLNSSKEKSNLLLQAAGTNAGLHFGPYYVGSRYSHGGLLAETETWFSTTPWGTALTSTRYRPRLFVYTGTNLDKTLASRISYMFEYTDPVAGIGYRRGVYAAFTVEEALLTRAEANIQLKNYTEALNDMNIWLTSNVVNPSPSTLTVQNVNSWANALEESTPEKGTPKKKLNPDFQLEEGDQTNMIHAILMMRRLETIHMGLRWFDIKRYGIEIARRTVRGKTSSETAGNSGTVVGAVDSQNKLKVRDNRQALQLPNAIIAAGLEANPR